MNRMKEIRAEISENDSAQRFSKFMGIDVFLGHAEFTGKNTVLVNGQELKFKKATIASGGRPYIPAIEGINDVKFCTSDSIFNLTKLPETMLIIGSGPIGCELGQGFARLGSNVTIFERGDHFLPVEDADCAVYLQEQMKDDGVNFMFNTSTLKFEKTEDGKVKCTYQTKGSEPQTLVADVLLLATGRIPNVENLGLDKAGV
jgi:pyruvate/2-oxoglutarate dehydrogenase complex dihydrolipoamide dehydrogenase (E3) component